MEPAEQGRATLASVAAAALLAVAVIPLAAAIRLQDERDAVLDEQRRANRAESKALAARSQALFTAAPESVPFIIESLKDRKEYGPAIADFEAALQLEPRRSEPCNCLARLYATGPEPLRNPHKAQLRARQAV